jgi:hypothetical protein
LKRSKVNRKGVEENEKKGINSTMGRGGEASVFKKENE